MTHTDLVIILLNAVGAGFGCACNVWSALVGDPRMAPIRWAVAAVAAVYVVAYMWLFHTQDIAEWSKVMRGVSLVVWPVVWGFPALIGGYRSRRVIEEIKQLAEG